MVVAAVVVDASCCVRCCCCRRRHFAAPHHSRVSFATTTTSTMAARCVCFVAVVVAANLACAPRTANAAAAVVVTAVGTNWQRDVAGHFEQRTRNRYQNTAIDATTSSVHDVCRTTCASRQTRATTSSVAVEEFAPRDCRGETERAVAKRGPYAQEAVP